MQTVPLRRLRKSIPVALAVYLAVFLTVNYVVDRIHPAGPSLWIFAALPVLPMLSMFLLLGRYLRDERDGYKRELVTRCLLWGAAGAMTLHLLTGFLRIFNWHGELPPFSELYAFAVLALIAKFSYRMANRVPADA